MRRIGLVVAVLAAIAAIATVVTRLASSDDRSSPTTAAAPAPKKLERSQRRHRLDFRLRWMWPALSKR